MSPGSRKRRGRSEAAPLDPEIIVKVLAKHRVRYVLIGALAARLQGFPRLTADADITPAGDRANLERLAAALRELEARVFTEGVPEGLPFECTAVTLERAGMWNLATSAGRIDIAFQPSGTGGYADLSKTSVTFEVFGAIIHVARLEDILRSKQAATRPKDTEDIALLQELIRRRASSS
jgi:hypothetical protein